MMKKIQMTVAAIAASFALSVSAQTNVTSVPNLITNGFWSDIGSVLGDVGLSSNPTNYAFGTFAGIKTSGDQYSIGAYVVENVNNYVGVIAGVDQLFGGGKLGSENIVSGGLTLQAPTYPLRFLTSATNTFAYDLRATPYVAALVATPIGGTGNAGGGLGGIARVGLNVDLYTFQSGFLSGWVIGAGIDYGNRTGAGAYNGNWVDGIFNLRKGF